MDSKLGVILCIFISFCAAEIPSFIKRCKPEDSDCIAEAANHILVEISKGHSDLNIPSLDPYNVPSLVIDHENATRRLNLNLDLKDLSIQGLSQLKFNKVVGFSKDPTSSKYELYGELPTFKTEGKYKSEGKVGELNIKGSGPFSVEIESSKVGIKFKPNVVTKDGKKYLEIKKLKVKFQPLKANIFIGNLFEGNEELTKQINVLLNANWRDAWAEFEPNVIKAAEGIIKNVAQKLLDQIPYDEMYLSD